MSDIQDNISSTTLPNNAEDILVELQSGLDINVSPFNSLAQKLGIDYNNLLNSVQQLLDIGIIREISPVFSARRIGYISTLVAVSAPDEVVPDFVKRVNSMAGVSHNYAREHKFNIWFTLTVPRSVAGADPYDPILSSLQAEYDVNEIISLPSQQMYKLKVQFSSVSASGSSDQPGSELVTLSPNTQPICINDEQKQLIRELQKGIPVIDRPFDNIAQSANSAIGSEVFDSENVVELLNIWKEEGAIRRIAGRVRHKKVGYQSNAMVVFKVGPEMIDDAGAALAGLPCVSHCYHRRTTDSWQYNLYAMTHAKSESELDSAISEMVKLIEPEQYDVLHTIKEYKKQSVKFFV